jgi:hypothetical protein
MKRGLFSAMVGDILDRMGYLQQVLPPRLRPVRDDMAVLGQATPVLEADPWVPWSRARTP